MDIKYSLILPIYNEQSIIRQVLTDLSSFLMNNLEDSYEIIAVNDGSTDKSQDVLNSLNLPSYKVLSNPYNQGYGAAIKLGAKHAQGKYLLFYDSDGQHQPRELPKLLSESDKFAMVVGSRQGYQGPLWRTPGKKLITALASYLVRFKIPDLNSGLRLVKKVYFDKFTHLYPNGFSLSTTLTLAFLKQGLSVKFVPITLKKRVGTSSLKISDGFVAINLVFRMIMLFSPLRIFLPASFIIFLLGFISLVRDIIHTNIADNTVLLLVSAILIFFFGLLADQLASIRRELKS